MEYAHDRRASRQFHSPFGDNVWRPEEGELPAFLGYPSWRSPLPNASRTWNDSRQTVSGYLHPDYQTSGSRAFTASDGGWTTAFSQPSSWAPPHQRSFSASPSRGPRFSSISPAPAGDRFLGGQEPHPPSTSLQLPEPSGSWNRPPRVSSIAPLGEANMPYPTSSLPQGRNLAGINRLPVLGSVAIPRDNTMWQRNHPIFDPFGHDDDDVNTQQTDNDFNKGDPAWDEKLYNVPRDLALDDLHLEPEQVQEINEATELRQRLLEEDELSAEVQSVAVGEHGVQDTVTAIEFKVVSPPEESPSVRGSLASSLPDTSKSGASSADPAEPVARVFTDSGASLLWGEGLPTLSESSLPTAAAGPACIPESTESLENPSTGGEASESTAPHQPRTKAERRRRKGQNRQSRPVPSTSGAATAHSDDAQAYPQGSSDLLSSNAAGDREALRNRPFKDHTRTPATLLFTNTNPYDVLVGMETLETASEGITTEAQDEQPQAIEDQSQEQIPTSKKKKRKHGKKKAASQQPDDTSRDVDILDAAIRENQLYWQANPQPETGPQQDERPGESERDTAKALRSKARERTSWTIRTGSSGPIAVYRSRPRTDPAPDGHPEGRDLDTAIMSSWESVLQGQNWTIEKQSSGEFLVYCDDSNRSRAPRDTLWQETETLRAPTAQNAPMLKLGSKRYAEELKAATLFTIANHPNFTAGLVTVESRKQRLKYEHLLGADVFRTMKLPTSNPLEQWHHTGERLRISAIDGLELSEQDQETFIESVARLLDQGAESVRNYLWPRLSRAGRLLVAAHTAELTSNTQVELSERTLRHSIGEIAPELNEELANMSYQDILTRFTGVTSDSMSRQLTVRFSLSALRKGGPPRDTFLSGLDDLWDMTLCVSRLVPSNSEPRVLAESQAEITDVERSARIFFMEQSIKTTNDLVTRDYRRLDEFVGRLGARKVKLICQDTYQAWNILPGELYKRFEESIPDVEVGGQTIPAADARELARTVVTQTVNAASPRRPNEEYIMEAVDRSSMSPISKKLAGDHLIETWYPIAHHIFVSHKDRMVQEIVSEWDVPPMARTLD